MTCERALPLLSAYFDRELGVAESVEVEGHVQECDRCSAALRRHDALRSSLTSPALVFTPPSGLEWRVRKAMRQEARRVGLSPRPSWRWTRVPLAAALAAALSWNVAVRRGETLPESVVPSELVSAHVRSLMANHLVDVATSDQHRQALVQWQGGFRAPVIDFTASGFPLVGGRVDYIARRPVAVVVYKRREHVLNVFVWPSGKDDDQGLRDLTFEGYHLLQWTRSGLTFWAVSDVNDADLKTLAGLFPDSG
jgi:anti-sigma factor RsiW